MNTREYNLASAILQACLQSDSSHAVLFAQSYGIVRHPLFLLRSSVFICFCLSVIRAIRAIRVRYQLISALSALSAGLISAIRVRL